MSKAHYFYGSIKNKNKHYLACKQELNIGKTTVSDNQIIHTFTHSFGS